MNDLVTWFASVLPKTYEYREMFFYGILTTLGAHVASECQVLRRARRNRLGKCRTRVQPFRYDLDQYLFRAL